LNTLENTNALKSYQHQVASKIAPKPDKITHSAMLSNYRPSIAIIMQIYFQK